MPLELEVVNEAKVYQTGLHRSVCLLPHDKHEQLRTNVHSMGDRQTNVRLEDVRCWSVRAWDSRRAPSQSESTLLLPLSRCPAESLSHLVVIVEPLPDSIFPLFPPFLLHSLLSHIVLHPTSTWMVHRISFFTLSCLSRSLPPSSHTIIRVTPIFLP